MKVWLTVDDAPRVSDIEHFPASSPLREKVYRIFFEIPYKKTIVDYDYVEGDYHGKVIYNIWGTFKENIYSEFFYPGIVIDKDSLPEGIEITSDSPVELDIKLKIK